jgi:hypothetical protein
MGIDVQSIYKPFQRAFRPRRMRSFVQYFNVTNDTPILDAGGTPLNWSFIPQRPQVTMINIFGKEWAEGNMRMMVYDGSTFPFPDNSFDVCYSNSVIEHVGDRSRIEHFASEIRRVAPRYYVQTPNLWFFVEPHFLCLFIHWLPLSIMRRLIRYFSVWGWVVKPDQAHVDRAMADILLLTRKDMQKLFPDAEIVVERFAGMTKSIIARKR